MTVPYRKIPSLIIAFLMASVMAIAQYPVHYTIKDSIPTKMQQRLRTSFPDQRSATQYINSIPAQWAALGYAAASVDEAIYTKDSATVRLWAGGSYSFRSIRPDAATRAILQQAGILWRSDPAIADLQKTNELLLDHFENTGHPFGMVVLDSVQWNGTELQAVLHAIPGPLYKIDSIHVVGNVKLSPVFLQRYLSMPNGAWYNKRSLDRINKKIDELPYVQRSDPWRLSMMAGGGVLDLYLQPKRSSQVYVLLGLMPANQQLGGTKLLLTGEANINLKNALAAGETIGINWQQIQYRSPRLDLQFQYPYIFRSPFGLDVGFELFKKDSQWVNINARVGILYELGPQQSGKVFIRSQTTNVTYIDSNTVRRTRKLPSILDISSVSVGVEHQFNNTNYRFNPRSGWDAMLQVSAGLKKVKPNNTILKLKDPAQPAFNYATLYDSVKASSYQLRVKAQVARYFSLGRQTVFKAAMQGGWFQSPSIFNNELFQIGGSKLLRGFDEESIFANAYAVLTAEFRYLIGTNSYFFGFADGGRARYQQADLRFSHTYVGTGIGLTFETGNSLLSMSVAVGKRNDLPLDLKRAKIHIGFVNFF